MWPWTLWFLCITILPSLLVGWLIEFMIKVSSIQTYRYIYLNFSNKVHQNCGHFDYSVDCSTLQCTGTSFKSSSFISQGSAHYLAAIQKCHLIFLQSCQHLFTASSLEFLGEGMNNSETIVVLLSLQVKCYNSWGLTIDDWIVLMRNFKTLSCRYWHSYHSPN